MAQIVSNIPKLFINKYVGTNPPPKNIVTTNILEIKLLPTSSFCAKAYPAITDVDTLNNANNVEYINEFINPLIIAGSESIVIYPSNVHSETLKLIPSFNSVTGSVKDAISMYTSGYKIEITTAHNNNPFNLYTILSNLLLYILI